MGLMDHETEPQCIRFAAFDTNVALTVYGLFERAGGVLEKARQRCAEYERLFSVTIPESDVARLNRAKGAWVSVDERTAKLIQCALGYCERSEGAFDITIGAVGRLWDLKRGIIPSAEDVAKAVRHVDWRSVHVDEERGLWRVRLEDPEAMIDLGGIAKGWIADELGAFFAQAEASGYVVDLGGNVLMGGKKPDGRPWKVALPSVGSDGLERTVTLERGSVVTSGIYERFCQVGGTRYHHILDPRTGMPAAVGRPWVSALCERSLDAEGYSTTLLVLGPERAKDLKRAHPEILQVWYGPKSTAAREHA